MMKKREISTNEAFYKALKENDIKFELIENSVNKVTLVDINDHDFTLRKRTNRISAAIPEIVQLGVTGIEFTGSDIEGIGIATPEIDEINGFRRTGAKAGSINKSNSKKVNKNKNANKANKAK